MRNDRTAFLNFGRELRTPSEVVNDIGVVIKNDNFVPEITPYLKKLATFSTQIRERRSPRDFNTKVTIILRHITGLDNPGEPLCVYHTSVLTLCNNDRLKPLIPLRKRGRPPKVPQTLLVPRRDQRGRM
ncbi:hypothetical protein TNCV_3704851 [Trichonephila clavipes]|nr:hypothetical protein TNCV_3704851 [Trichonephila clavipes]